MYILKPSLVHKKWRRATLENFVIMIVKKKIDKVILSAWSYFLQQTTFPMRKKKRAILLTSCGIKTYRLFKGPVEKTFDELVTLMTNYENPKRNPIAEISV